MRCLTRITRECDFPILSSSSLHPLIKTLFDLMNQHLLAHLLTSRSLSLSLRTCVIKWAVDRELLSPVYRHIHHHASLSLAFVHRDEALSWELKSLSRIAAASNKGSFALFFFIYFFFFISHLVQSYTHRYRISSGDLMKSFLFRRTRRQSLEKQQRQRQLECLH